MSYKPKPARRPTTREEQQGLSLAVQSILASAAEVACEETGCTGVSFIVMSMAVLMLELAEIDGRSAAQFLAALSVMADPAASTAEKEAAERKKRDAAGKIFQAVDLNTAVDTSTKN